MKPISPRYTFPLQAEAWLLNAISYFLKKQGITIMKEKEIITQMLQIENDACQLIEETKEKANKLLLQARNKAKRLSEETKKSLSQDREILKKRVQDEAEMKIEKITKEKQTAMDKIDAQEKQKRGLAIQKIRKFLFEEFLGGL